MQPKQDDGYRQTWALKLKIPDILTIKTGSHWIKIVSSFKIRQNKNVTFSFFVFFKSSFNWELTQTQNFESVVIQINHLI